MDWHFLAHPLASRHVNRRFLEPNVEGHETREGTIASRQLRRRRDTGAFGR